MAPKKNPANPTKLGTGSNKGKAKAHLASPEPQEDENPLEPEYFVLPDLSDNNYAQPVYSPPPKKESK